MSAAASTPCGGRARSEASDATLINPCQPECSAPLRDQHATALAGGFAMTSELNFEAMPFEYHGEVPQPFSSANATGNEEFEHGGQHRSGGHHQHHHHRRRRRFGAPHWPVSSFPIDASPFDDGDDDGSQPPSDGAGDFESEAEAEAEYRYR